MANQWKVGTHKTRVYVDEGFTIVKYWRTKVVKFNEEHIILDNGGWLTATTKLRMNQASNEYSLGYQVYQEDCSWYVIDCFGNIKDFKNGMILKRMKIEK